MYTRRKSWMKKCSHYMWIWTWDLVSILEGVSGCLKFNTNGIISRYKARLRVMHIFMHRLWETFSRLLKMAIVQAIIFVATSRDSMLPNMGVKNAFLRYELQKEHYRRDNKDLSHQNYVCKFYKALRLVPSAWHIKAFVNIDFHMTCWSFVVACVNEG